MREALRGKFRRRRAAMDDNAGVEQPLHHRRRGCRDIVFVDQRAKGGDLAFDIVLVLDARRQAFEGQKIGGIGRISCFRLARFSQRFLGIERREAVDGILGLFRPCEIGLQ